MERQVFLEVFRLLRQLNCRFSNRCLTPSPSSSLTVSYFVERPSLASKSIFSSSPQPFQNKMSFLTLSSSHSSHCPFHNITTLAKLLQQWHFHLQQPPLSPPDRWLTLPSLVQTIYFLDTSMLMDSMRLCCCGDDLDMFPPDSVVLALTPAPYVLFNQRLVF